MTNDRSACTNARRGGAGIWASVAIGLAVGAYAQASSALTNAERAAAASETATTHPYCTALTNFYWEIGDGTRALVSGTWGGAPPRATTQMPIYSASKWVYGAYVYQRRGGVLNGSDVQALRMLAGYAQSSDCVFNTTIGSCFAEMDSRDPGAIDKYYYSAGNLQKHASADMGLTTMNKTQLATEIHSYLGSDWVFTYTQPQVAGHGKSSAADFAKFLRKMLKGDILLSGGALGSNPVCTYTGWTNWVTGRRYCDAALYSPMDDNATGIHEDWHYSIAHWVEDDPVEGDGAFSSPGAAGFYPWIDASRTWYGVLARNVAAATSSADSVRCGRIIRKAWITGTAQ